MSSVDVVVPCYRYAHYLRQCVESVLSQAGCQVRVLIIDDASPDNTQDVAEQLRKQDSRVYVLTHTENKGHIATYNDGIEWASADYMLLLSADDFLLPGALSRATMVLDKHDDVGLAFGQAIVLDDNTREREHSPDSLESYDLLQGKEFIQLTGARNIVPTPTAVVRTELQKCIGGYRSELPHSGDMEMWLRFASHGSLARLHAYQAVYRYHANNMSTSYYRRQWIGDIKQRSAAITTWFEQCGSMIQGGEQLCERMRVLLGYEAIGNASAAFNDGDLDLSVELATYAVALVAAANIIMAVDETHVQTTPRRFLLEYPETYRGGHASYGDTL